MPLVLIAGLGGAAALVLGATWLLRSGRSQVVRALALGADIGLVCIGAALVGELSGGDSHGLAYLIIGSLVAGAGVHALGVIAWEGDVAWAARAVGSILVGAALVVPTVLTLALPLVGLLALTLWRSAPGAERDAG